MARSWRFCWPLLFLVVAVLLGSGSGCGPTPPPPSSGQGAGAVKAIGFAGPLTGDSAQFGAQLRMGAELAIEELNAAGGLHGSKIQGLFEDDAANPREAGSVAQKLAGNPSVYAVIGHFNSSCSLAGKPIYKEAGLMQISPASTNVNVCRGSEWTFRNIYDDAFQGQTLASYTKRVLGHSKVAVFYDNDDYGIGLKDSFDAQAAKEGLQVVFSQSYKRETSDYRPHLAKFRELAPEAIMIAGLYAQASLIARQARESGLMVPLLGGDGVLSDEYVRIAEKAADNTYISCPFLFELGGDKAAAFKKAFEARFKIVPDAWAALAYDAVGIVADAVKKGGWDRRKIRDQVALRIRPDMAYPGVTGATYFDEHGDCKKPIQMAVVKDGKIVPAPRQMP